MIKKYFFLSTGRKAGYQFLASIFFTLFQHKFYYTGPSPARARLFQARPGPGPRYNARPGPSPTKPRPDTSLV